ncbi:hypothetical protein P3T36_007080 [Kitasatospora sp. MAP12-15]|nr:hypothetical protein [Kitasatospora sp. MAP12-44]
MRYVVRCGRMPPGIPVIGAAIGEHPERVRVMCAESGFP